jgi:uncharacterized protein HemY
MSDRKADADALIQETMALTKSIRAKPLILSTTADHEVVITTLNEAALIVSDYLEAGHTRDPVETINRLIKVLDRQKPVAAIMRMEKGHGPTVVK